MVSVYDDALECECYLNDEYCHCEQDCACGCTDCDCAEWESVVNPSCECGGNCQCGGNIV